MIATLPATLTCARCFITVPIELLDLPDRCVDKLCPLRLVETKPPPRLPEAYPQ